MEDTEQNQSFGSVRKTKEFNGNPSDRGAKN